MNYWKSVWNKRSIDRSGSVLQQLLRADGYDTDFGKTDEDHFLSFLEIMNNHLQAETNDTFFEVGCGAGAVLYPFFLKGHKVSGIDYSASLIEAAKYVMKDMVFSVEEADHLDVHELFDIVISFGVFIYFENYEYAECVLEKMICKANKTIGVFDISDIALRQEAEQFRRGEVGAEDYEGRYKDLDHLYYPKSFFENIAKKHHCRIRIFPQEMSEYRNSFYRYNVVLYK